MPINIEIERKFLPKDNEQIPFTSDNSDLVQVYIQNPGETTVCRVRIVDKHKAFITMKAPSTDSGLSRIELECAIPLAVAEKMITDAPRESIIKERYRIPHGELTFEVDVFAGVNSDLTLIEVELPTIDTKLQLPKWVGEEVTSDMRYTNAYMSDNPYNFWD